MVKKKRKEVKKEKFKEIFQFEKGDKEKIVEVKGEIEEKIENKGQKESEDKQLIIILSVCGLILALIFGGIVYKKMATNFEIDGVNYDIIKEKDVTFYHTSFLIEKGLNKVVYNVYIRNDPRKLIDRVDFEGDLRLTRAVVINVTDDVGLNCEGDGVIAVANLKQVLEIGAGAEVYSSEEGCDSAGRYTFMNIKPGNETRIVEVGKSCYDIEIKECEMLIGTERMIVEIIDGIN